MHYTYKAMRDFAKRLSRELDLDLNVGQFSSTKKSRRYYLSEWNDIYGYGWIDINIGVYDKEQQRINLSQEIFGGGDVHSLSACSDEVQAIVKSARRRGYPLVWIEMAIRTRRHKCHEQRFAIVPCKVLSEAWAFDGIKEWLEEQRAKRVSEDKPHIAETIKFINKMRYTDIDGYSNGIISVCDNGKYGFINDHGEPICDIIYDSCVHDESIYLAVKQNGKWAYMKQSGEMVTPFMFDNVSPFQDNGYARVGVDGKDGIINLQGEWVVEPKYDDIDYRIQHFPEIDQTLVRVTSQKKDGIINIHGEEIIPCKYESFSFSLYSEGYIPARKDGKWGFITIEDKVAIPFEYDYANEFKDGVARVQVGDEWFYIDKDGNRVDYEEDDDDLPF